jgi:lipid A 3-O-deacylase
MDGRAGRRPSGRSRVLLAVVSLVATGAAPPRVVSADATEAAGYEVRLGAFTHGVGGAERNTYDLNPEFLFPRLPFGRDRWWHLLLPRPHVGGLINLEGRTSSVYAGALWTLPVTQRLFGELFFDGATHNGYTNAAPPDRSELGCAYLFHVGGSIGYYFSEHWSWMATVDHESNGHSVFGIACQGRGADTHNQGFNDYGMRFGYAF